MVKSFTNYWACCALALLLVSSTSAFGQGYLYNTIENEMQDYMMALQNNPTLVMSAPADNSMSEVQTIPFEFPFFGEVYTEFRVSDNGYLSFDVNDMNSQNTATSLPMAGSPRAAIFAFWGPLALAEGGSADENNIISATFGSEPNRVHVIQWSAVTPEGQAPSAIRKMTFSIALHENGKFDINFTAGRYLGAFDAGAGAQNAAGDMAAVIAAPEFRWPASGSIPLTYRFVSLDRDYDAAVVEFTLPKKIVVSEDAIPVGAKVQNVGNKSINSLDVTLEITGSGGFTFKETRTFIDLDLTSNETWTLDNYMWTLNTPGEVMAVSVSVDNINGDMQLDEVPENNGLVANTFGYLDISGSKRVLIEEFTGTWCGHCGEGAMIVEEIVEEFPNVVAIGVHGGSSVDPMIIPHGQALAGRYRPGYPQALVDRRQFEGQEEVLVSRGFWSTAAELSMNGYTPLNLDISSSYDASTREIQFEATATFVDFHEPADMRLHVYVVENNVSDPDDPRYSQVNYYNGVPGHPHEGAGNPIVGFVHQHVLRAAPTGLSGIRIVPVDGYAPESQFSNDYSFTLTDDMKAEDIELIAFVSYEGGELNENVVITSTKSKLEGDLSTSVNDLRGGETVGLMSPNPSVNLATLNVHLERTQLVQLDLYAVNGTHLRTVTQKQAFAGDHSFAIDTSNLSNGSYNVRMLVGDQVVWRSLVVAR